MRTQITRKKVLFVVTLSHIGGAQKYVVDLAKELLKEMEVVVAAGGEPEGWLLKSLSAYQRISVSAIRTYHLSHLQRSTGFFREFLTLFDIIKVIRKEKPDVLHLNSTKIGGLGGLAGWLTKTPSVYTVHGLVLNDPWPWYLKILYWIAEKIAFFYNNAVITVSHFDEQSVLKYKLAPKKKIRTIHLALPPESVTFLPREKARKKILDLIQTNQAYQRISVSAYQPLIGNIAGHFLTKDVGTFIVAAKIVLEKMPEAIFFNIGTGPETENLKLKIKHLALEDHFFLLGSISNASELLLGFDLFVLSSIKEGLPYTLLEAAAASISVVTTHVGGIPEIAHRTAWMLVPPKNSQALADAILKAFNQKTENQKPLAPEELVKNFQKFMKETKEVYHSVTADH